MSYDSVYTPVQSKWSFNQEQSKLMTRSFTYTGMSFVAIFIFSFTLYYILRQSNSGTSTADVFLYISPILILVSSLMGMFLRAKTHGSMGFAIFVYALYIFAQSIGIGGLLYAINYSQIIGLQSGVSLIDIASIFGVAGVMFIAMALIGINMSKRATAKFSKFIIAATIGWLLSSLVFSITMIFSGGGWGANSWLIIVSTLIGGLLNLGYIIFIVSQIKQTSEFVDCVGNRTLTNSLAASFGFWMLVNLMGIVWTLIRFFFIIRR